MARSKKQEKPMKERITLIQERWQTVRLAIKVSGLTVVGWKLFDAVSSSAGLTTIWQIAGSLDVSEYAAYFIASVTGAGYLWERHMRKRYIEQHNPRVKMLEQVIDPSRSSSDLTLRGDNKPEDDK